MCYEHLAGMVVVVGGVIVVSWAKASKKEASTSKTELFDRSKASE